MANVRSITAFARSRWFVLLPVVGIMFAIEEYDKANLALILPYIHGIGLTPSQTGFAGGVGALGLIFLPVPALMLARKIGIRAVIAIAMVCWSVAAISSGLVHTTGELFAARFALGLFEGIVPPAVYLLFASWFLDNERSRANSIFIACSTLGALIGNPITGMLIDVVDWRATFIIEGALPIIWLLPWLIFTANKPTRAWWMRKPVAHEIERRLEVEQQNARAAQLAAETVSAATFVSTWRALFSNRRFPLLVLTFFLILTASKGIGLWFPTVIRSISTNASASAVGWLTDLPTASLIVAAVIVSTLADKTRRFRVALAVPLLVGAVALVAGQLAAAAGASAVVLLVLLCFANTAPSVVGTFWSFPTRLLPAAQLTVAVAIISAIGSGVGGFAGPYIVGWLFGIAGSQLVGFIVMGLIFLAAAAIAVFGLKSPVEKVETTDDGEPGVPVVVGAAPDAAIFAEPVGAGAPASSATRTIDPNKKENDK